MNYIDPHHKRIEFMPESFRTETECSERRLIFMSQDEQKSVTLHERGSHLAVAIAGEIGEFVLWKIQLLEKHPSWLTLDFKDDPRLSRIVVHIEKFSAEDLDASLKEIIGSRSLLYFRH